MSQVWSVASAAQSSAPGPHVPWGPRTVAYGVSALIALQMVVGLVAAALMSGFSIESEDSARGARLALAAAALYDAGLVGLVIGLTRLSPRELFVFVGLTPVREAQVWLSTPKLT